MRHDFKKLWNAFIHNTFDHTSLSGIVQNVPRNTYVAGIQNGHIRNAISNTVIKRAKNVALLLTSLYLTYYVVHIQQNFQSFQSRQVYCLQNVWRRLHSLQTQFIDKEYKAKIGHAPRHFFVLLFCLWTWTYSSRPVKWHAVKAFFQ